MKELQITIMDLPTDKHEMKCPYSLEPKGVVIHNTANDASAVAEISYMQSNSSYTSFHYAVDDLQAVQGISLSRNAWHAGDGLNGYANRNLLSIEICYSLSGGERFAKAEQNAAKLAAQLCAKYGWGVDRVTKHQDYRNTECPRLTVELGWDRFLGVVQKELEALGASDSQKNLKLLEENRKLKEKITKILEVLA